MRAVTISEYGEPEVLRIAERPDPVPGPSEIVVAIEHAGVNRADLSHRRGQSRDLLGQDVPGLEYAGRVAAVGKRVTLWKPGDRVMGIETGGCYAEMVATNERQALPVPERLELSDAAAIPEAFITAWDAIVVQGGFTSGRWALVHAGASGVGTAAIQIVTAVGGRVAVTCSAAKMQRCRDLGADLVLERSPADWASELRRAVPGGVAVVLDVVGGEEVNRNLAALATGGRLVQVGLMAGRTTPVDVGVLVARRGVWIGTTLKNRPPEEKVAISQRFADEVLPLFDLGSLAPVIDRHFPLEDAAGAHRRMEANENIGKLILDV